MSPMEARSFRVQPHYSVFLARRLHASGWSISRVINKITLARFWQASVIAANELSTSKINQSWVKELMHGSENGQIISGIYSWVGRRRSVTCHLRATGHRASPITHTNKQKIAIIREARLVLICSISAATRSTILQQLPPALASFVTANDIYVYERMFLSVALRDAPLRSLPPRSSSA